MRAGRSQTTLKGPCSVSGRGYWTGQPNTLTFLPAAAGTGVRFVRTDLDGRPSVRALAGARASMPLRTRLTQGRAQVDMVEHVMAALYGVGIDNVEVHSTAGEMPAMDGSSLAFTLALLETGKTPLEAPRTELRISRPIRIGDDRQWILAEPAEHDSLEIEYRLDYGQHTPIGKSTYRAIVNEQTFFQSLAPARTFVRLTDAQAMQAKGIARHVTERDLLVFDDRGPVNNELRFPDECARHKALDVVGDLALTGFDLVGRVIACRSGHQLNGQMATKLQDMLTEQNDNFEGVEGRRRSA